MTESHHFNHQRAAKGLKLQHFSSEQWGVGSDRYRSPSTQFVKLCKNSHKLLQIARMKETFFLT